ncbi:hypothetical protein PQC43_gp095 [Escherichia phage vB_EcoP-101114UKE3]|uniref:Uncharacterized protein n=1 Tax=Escherichia phage vB_EcoP-101114UKE3 TaxID=2865794 RepID=A0AAE7XSV7_9CAUD|nr:hypothetical protein PQC43_gp095 [Escherichia phage vB_EcoP-101114UKE3]QZI79226.1 hypothetical protein 101114UKE3_095 [Escherichia phage vB_EcoP-101114UKE3]USM81199.1 hypothetical protein 101114BS3_072 [Escherichia phage vB_EcoP-101114BS3]
MKIWKHTLFQQQSSDSTEPQSNIYSPCEYQRAM